MMDMVNNYVTEELCNEKHKDITEIKDDIKLIKLNHLAHMEKDINDMKLLFAEVKFSNNFKNKVLWIIAGAVLTSVTMFVLNHFGIGV